MATGRRHRTESLTSPRRIAAVEKQRQALELRKGGATYAAIAQTMGLRSPQHAHYSISTALKRTLQEPAAQVRALEIERLDTLFLVLWPMVQVGNLKAIDRMLRVMERRAALLGLDRGRTEPEVAAAQAAAQVVVRVVLQSPNGAEKELGEWRRAVLTESIQSVMETNHPSGGAIEANRNDPHRDS